jgi:predicted MFS family arabinose efflux permease
LFCYGAAAGSMDVAMNAQGVTVEKSVHRSIMSSLHALFSVGGMAGAFAGGQIARAGVTPGAHFVATGLLCAAFAAVAVRPMIADHVEASGPMFALPRRSVLALGVLGFCMLLCEGAIADWIAIFLRDAMSAGAGTAAAGYAVFSAAMAVGRFGGDAMTDRFGARAVVQWGSALAAAALTATLSAMVVPLSLAALAFVGLGYAAIVPNVFTASARIPNLPPGVGIASVTTMGYFGFLVGPPAIGWLAEYSSLRGALFLLVVLTAASAVLTPFALKRTRIHQSPGSSAPVRP